MDEAQKKKNLEKKIALDKFADTAVRVLSPNILKYAGEVFDWDVKNYDARLKRDDLFLRDQARDELIKSAQLYISIIDNYSRFTSHPPDYNSRREYAESLLGKLNGDGPSAMWDVQPGA